MVSKTALFMCKSRRFLKTASPINSRLVYRARLQIPAFHVHTDPNMPLLLFIFLDQLRTPDPRQNNPPAKSFYSVADARTRTGPDGSYSIHGSAICIIAQPRDILRQAPPCAPVVMWRPAHTLASHMFVYSGRPGQPPFHKEKRLESPANSPLESPPPGTVEGRQFRDPYRRLMKCS